MARNGTGTYTLPAGVTASYQQKPIESSKWNAAFNDLATEVTDSLSRSGKGGFLANISAGNYKLTSLAVATTTGDALSYGRDATVAALTATGNIALNGTSLRLTGDFTSATIASRALVQTSTADAATNFGIVPSGTARISAVTVFNDSTPQDTEFGQLYVSDTEVALKSSKTGTSPTALPLTFHVDGAERMRIAAAGNVTINAPSSGNALTVNGTLKLGKDYEETVASSTGNTTIDLANGTIFIVTTNGNNTITLPSSVAGKSYLLFVKYTGVHTITWAGGSTIKWSGGSAPSQTKVNGKTDIFSFICDGTNTYGQAVGLSY